MKKIVLFFIILIAFCGTVNANEKTPCIETQEILSNTTDCQSEEYKNRLSELFLKEREEFLKNTKDLYKNNSTHPNKMAQKAIQNIKQSQSCFKKLCKSLVNSCQNKDGTQLSELDRNQQCQKTAQIFLKTHLIETIIATKQNSHRKSHGIIREKFRQLEGTMRQYFVPLYVSLLNALADFDGKFTNFTANPS